MFLAKTLDTTSASSTRRRLFGGAAAVVIGGGITAGAAASVADLVPTDPDAHLIALCALYVEADVRHQELCNQQDAFVQPLTPASNAEWGRLDDLALAQGGVMLDLEPLITTISATSPAGLQAKARVVARMSRFYKDDNGAGLLRSLLSDLLPAGRA